MLVQPSRLDPADPPTPQHNPSIPGQVPLWLLGFHGAVPISSLHGLDELDLEPPSVRSIALGRRSLGIEPLRTLTDLSSLRRVLLAPSSTNGARPVIANPATLDPTSPPPPPPSAVGPMPESERLAAQFSSDSTESAEVVEPWSTDEPMPNYIDRRLLRAKVLYLPNRGRAYAFGKRLLDIVGALGLLVLASPVMLLLGWLIRRDSPGPAIFRQQRVTRGGRLFTFYKFRTMWADAPQRFPALYDYATVATSSDVYYKLSDDPRSTNVGRWLRRTTLDELPNLLNVLRGDMSLVGPRPELPGLVPLYRPEELALFFTKAGLTGLAQIAGRSLLTVRERISLDLRYVTNQTLLLDIRILIGTIRAVLQRRGAF